MRKKKKDAEGGGKGKIIIFAREGPKGTEV